MCDTCGDNRFELIEKYKQKLLDATNIEDSPEEMAVIDNILFRFWQMGWLEKLESSHKKDHVADPGKMVGDLISRAAALDALGERPLPWTDDDDYVIGGRNQYDSDRLAIETVPSARQEIVACGDCKHWICHDRRCGYWNHGVKPLEWCCHAERRADE